MIKAFTLGLIMGAVIGTGFGVLIMACVQAGKDDDYMANKISHAKDPDRVNKMKAMSEVKLKPCPFCGDDNPFLHNCEYRQTLWTITCPKCKIEITVPVLRDFWSNSGVRMGKEQSNENRLVEAWNCRTPENPSRTSENAPNSGGNNSGE